MERKKALKKNGAKAEATIVVSLDEPKPSINTIAEIIPTTQKEIVFHSFILFHSSSYII
ncbi:hypothetical protein M1146_05100 [Patescibacteria group bacterium]|nr:hypothetical protein [Patescibacteria group bacterium]